MSTFVLGAAVAAVAITGLLTWLLYRMNAPALDEARRGKQESSGGDGGAVAYGGAHSGSRHSNDHDNGGGDSGGGDGGGGE